MRAVIMAGGEGSRLRPLTCDLPKPMVPLCGRPILEYILDLLAEHGFTQAAITLRYLPKAILDHFPDGSYRGIALRFVQEETPMGTAGGVRGAYEGGDEPVLVISADAMCDFDLTRAMAFHQSHQRDVTILVKRVADPREYGLVACGEDGCITKFLEKPDYTQAVSDLANTGIYILSQRALEQIPLGVSYDFSKDLFPALMAAGDTLMALEEKGYWCDIGDLQSYAQCQRDILHRRVACSPAGEWDENGNCIDPSACLSKAAVVRPPIYLGRDVHIESGAVLEQAVVDRGCQVGRSRLTGAVLLADCYVGDGCGITGGILCHGASVQSGAMVFEGAAIGAGAVLGRDSTVKPGVKIWPGKVVSEGCAVLEHVKFGVPKTGCFEENGICGTAGVEITPEYCSRIGAALGSLSLRGAIALGHSGGRAAAALCDALRAGVLSTGREVWDFGRCFLSLFGFGVHHYPVALGVYLEGGEPISIRLLDREGLSVSRSVERSVEGTLGRGEFVRAGADRFGRLRHMGELEPLYLAQAGELAPQGLSGMAVQVKSANPQVEELARLLLESLGCDTHRGICLEIGGDGTTLTLHGRECGHLGADKMLALCCIDAFEGKEMVSVPFDAPRVFERIAQGYGQRLFRYLRSPADNSDAAARRVAAGQHWTRDGIWQAVRLLHLLQCHDQKIPALLSLLPAYGLASTRLATEGNPAGILRAFHGVQATASEGVVLCSERGTVLLQPSKNGKAVKILAEAASSELAEELCGQYIHQMAELLKAQGNTR